MENKELIDNIVEIEWEMMQDVNTGGPKVSCQSDFKTFSIMRGSQAVSWSEAALESFLRDLIDAYFNGRNLLTEKYARMMESTDPEVYHAEIEHRLPALEPEAIRLIDEITEIVIEWEEELKSKYPDLRKKGRPTYSTEDSKFYTSVETYLRGELATYSVKTLELYYENIKRQKSENINGSEITLRHMVKEYGYTSLEQANEKLRSSL